MERLGVILVYSGGAMFVVGLLRLIWLAGFRRSLPRRPAWRWIGIGAALLTTGFVLPSRETRVAAQITLHDRFAPVYQFNEVHEIEVSAGREQVYEAIKQTTAGEILFFRALTWIRRLGRAGPENILNAPAKRPILDVAAQTSFLLLADEPGREIVVGTLVLGPAGRERRQIRTPEEFASLEQPGYAKATMNFLVEEIRPEVCRVRTETRVYAGDARAQRRFAAYWRVIYPGSALIRHMWLRAIRLRALGAKSA